MPLLTSRFAVAGLPVEVRSDHPVPIALLEELFGDDPPGDPNDPSAIPGLPALRSLRIDVHVLDSVRLRAVTPPNAVYRLPGHQLPDVSFEVDLPRLVCRLGRSVARGDCDERRFAIEIDPADLDDPDRLRRVLLATPVFCTMNRSVAAGIHAAALGLAGGGAVLVRAGSGGGKSTLAAAWVATGGTLLAEESAWIPWIGARSEPAGRQPLVYGFSREIELLPEGAALLAPAFRFAKVRLDPVVTPSGERKLRWDLSESPSLRRREPLAAVVVLEREAPAKPGDAAGRLTSGQLVDAFRASAVPEEGPWERFEPLLRKLAASLPVHRLRSAANPIELAAELRELVDR